MQCVADDGEFVLVKALRAIKKGEVRRGERGERGESSQDC